MGLLSRTLAIALFASACYEPDVRDCTVKCSGASDCAGGQVCGGDGYCVDSDAVRCRTGATQDGGTTSVTPIDAHVTDAHPPVDAVAPDAAPDAPTHGLLIVDVDGKGGVLSLGVGWCEEHCEYTLPLDSVVLAHASPGDDFEFDRWTTGACPDEKDPDCAVTITAVVSLGARFRKDKDD
jgi:hypothetical protein